MQWVFNLMNQILKWGVSSSVTQMELDGGGSSKTWGPTQRHWLHSYTDDRAWLCILAPWKWTGFEIGWQWQQRYNFHIQFSSRQRSLCEPENQRPGWKGKLEYSSDCRNFFLFMDSFVNCKSRFWTHSWIKNPLFLMGIGFCQQNNESKKVSFPRLAHSCS